VTARKRKVKRVARKRAARRVARKRVARNPPAAVMSRRVVDVVYVHAGDGKRYIHRFAPGVVMTAIGDKEIRLHRPDGKSISQVF
jgi:hypothetical protein